jgi:two-component system cell cycle response regulator
MVTPFDAGDIRRDNPAMATILLVEDNPDNIKLFTAVLAARGHEVVTLMGGDGVPAALRAHRPALVLLDIQLPGADGFQVLETLRASGAALPPVVALTAHAMAGDRERALAAGFDGYLTKPIDVATFGVAVERFLAGSRGTREQGAADI